MKGLMILLALGLASSDKLDRTYLPPPGAKASGGNLGAVDAPSQLPKESSSTTIRPRPRFPERPGDTKLTAGINRGQPSSTGAPIFTSTTRPFVSEYFPSTTPSSYTQTTTPEGFGTTSSPIGSTGFPSESPDQKFRPVYGPNGQVIGVTPTPGPVEICEENDVRCQKAQQVSPVYGPTGQIIDQQVSPTPGSVKRLRPVYGSDGEIIGVTPTPGTAESCKEGDVRCQKQGQYNVPVYGPSGQIIGYQPSVTLTTGTTPGLRPVYGQDGEIIGVTPAPGTVDICKKGDVKCQKQGKQNVPVYGPSGQNIGYQPSVTLTPGTSPGLRPVYGQDGDIIGVTPASGTVDICEEGDVSCQKQGQQNVPVYGPSGQIVGYQPSVTSAPGTTLGVHPVYGKGGEIIGVTPTPGTVVYSPSGQISGYQPNVNLTSGSASGLRPVYGQNGEVIGVTPAPVTQKQPKLSVPVYGPRGQIIGYQPTVSSTPETEQGLRSLYEQKGKIIGVTPSPGTVRDQEEQIIPVYGSDGQIIGYRPGVGSVTGKVQGFQPFYGPSGEIIAQKPSTTAPEGLRPVYGQNGEIIGVTPTPGTVKLCQEGEVNCQKKVVYEPSVTTIPEIAQGPISQGHTIHPVHGPNGQIIGYIPSVTPTPESPPNPQQFYGPSRQIISQQPGLTYTPGTVQVCKEGDLQCLKKSQQNIVFGPNGDIIGYQPGLTQYPGKIQGDQSGFIPSSKIFGELPNNIGVTPDPNTQSQQIVPVYGTDGQIVAYRPRVLPISGTVQRLQPLYGASGQIIVPQPTSESVQVCREGDVQCQKQSVQNVSVYGPSGQIVRYQPIVTPVTETSQGLQPIYGKYGEIVGVAPIPGTVEFCKEGDVSCKQRTEQNVPVYGPNGQIIGYQPFATRTLGNPQDPVVPKLTTIPVYGTNGQVIGFQPSVTKTFGTDKGLPVYSGLVQSLQPVYDSNGKIIGQRPAGLVQGCKEGDVLCQKQSQKLIPVYGPSGEVIGQQYSVTPTPGTLQDLQPVYGSSGQIIGQQPITTPTPVTVKICQTGDVQCQNQFSQIRPVYGSNGQIPFQQVTPTPGTISNIQPVYGPSGQIIGQQPTQLSSTTGKPITGGTKNIYRPESTSKPSVTTSSYYPSSSVGTTSAPYQSYGSTPAGVVITSAGSNAERPLAESDRKAITVNYDITITPDGYSYNYDTSNGIHVDETGDVKDGNKAVGTYSYIGDDGKEYQVTYKADENGFQPTGDHLPTPHPIPADIQRVIEQAVKDKQAGISDDGSYDEAKYGHDRFNRPNRPQSGNRTRPVFSGRKPSIPSEEEEGYYYTPPKSKFPPLLPGRGQTKRPQGKYGDKSTTPRVNFDEDEYDTENQRPGIVGPSNKSRPSGGQESGITTYRPTGQLDKYGRPFKNRQGQVDNYGKQIPSQPGQETDETVEPEQIDKYERTLSKQPGQGYSSTTYRPVGIGQEIGSTTYRPSTSKIGRPNYFQPEQDISAIDKPEQVDKYEIPVSRPVQRYSTTTYRPIGTTEPSQVDNFGQTIYSQPAEKNSEALQPVQIDEYGRPTSASLRPTQGYVDKFGRPIHSKPGQEISGTTYKPVATTEPSQVDRFGQPIYSQPGVEPSETDERGFVDKYGRPVTSRPEQGIGSTTYRPTVNIEPQQVDKFGRPIYSQSVEEVNTAEPSQVDKFGRPIPSRNRQEYNPTSFRPSESTGSSQLDAFGRPISPAPGQSSEGTQPDQLDKYGRPLPSRSGQRPSTSYKPAGTIKTKPVDEYGRPTSSYVPGESVRRTLSPQVDAYGRPINSKPGQRLSSVTNTPVSSTQAPGYQSGPDAPEGIGEKPEEFGPHEKQGPAYLSPYEDKTGKIIGEDFRGPKQPPRFDPKTGYHY